jgi:Family of unknown function (DUF6165)
MEQGVARISVSAGELLDRISILELKVERFTSDEKRERVRRELAELRDVCDATLRFDAATQALFASLKEVNGTLWEVEDKLRVCEHDETFGETFIALARSVYRLNDKRAAIKAQINAHVGSALTEEKSYSEYR